MRDDCASLTPHLRLNFACMQTCGVKEEHAAVRKKRVYPVEISTHFWGCEKGVLERDARLVWDFSKLNSLTVRRDVHAGAKGDSGEEERA